MNKKKITPAQALRVVNNMRKLKGAEPLLKNGLGGAILGTTNLGNNPYNNLFGEQISQTETLFKNLRWYLISNFRQLLSQAYPELGIVRIICDVPVDDALRGGVEISSSQLSEEDIQNLQAIMVRENILNTVGQALKWNRLYGGAGIIVITDQDPATPLDLNAISEDTPLEFGAVDMWELYWDQQNVDGFEIQFQQRPDRFYSYYGVEVHESRVFIMKGVEPPSFIKPRLRGWGLSALEPLVRPINSYLKATDLGFEVLDEFKIDIFKMKGLNSALMSPQGEATVQRRTQITNLQKNYQHAITMDSEDDYMQKQLSFAGLAEAMEGIRMQLASDVRMPLSKLFGTGSQGFSSGQDDIENYNGMIESEVRAKCKFDILRIIEIKCQQMFGYVPDDLEIEFKPLRILSGEQEENVKTAKFNRLTVALEKGQIDSKEFKEACNRDNLLSIQVDATKESLVPEANTPDDVAEASGKASAIATKKTPEAKS